MEKIKQYLNDLERLFSRTEIMIKHMYLVNCARDLFGEKFERFPKMFFEECEGESKLVELTGIIVADNSNIEYDYIVAVANPVESTEICLPPEIEQFFYVVLRPEGLFIHKQGQYGEPLVDGSSVSSEQYFTFAKAAIRAMAQAAKFVNKTPA